MKRIITNKRGFTLVEMMLALAVITIIGWTTVALMIATKDSFMTTYNTNDSADYAMLYSNGFENSFLEHTQNKRPGTFLTRKGDSVLEQNTNVPVFTPRQMKTTNRNDGTECDKWKVRIFFKKDESDVTQSIKYKIFVIDNYYSPVPKVTCNMEGTVWAPHLDLKKLTWANYGTDDQTDKDLRLAYGLAKDVWYNSITYKP